MLSGGIQLDDRLRRPTARRRVLTSHASRRRSDAEPLARASGPLHLRRPEHCITGGSRQHGQGVSEFDRPVSCGDHKPLRRSCRETECELPLLARRASSKSHPPEERSSSLLAPSTVSIPPRRHRPSPPTDGWPTRNSPDSATANRSTPRGLLTRRSTSSRRNCSQIVPQLGHRVRPTAIQNMLIWSYFLRSGRQDLNLRPPGPQSEGWGGGQWLMERSLAVLTV